jgi:hypothetical protein
MPDAPTLDLTRLPDGLRLTSGHHDLTTESEACAMDAIAWATTGEITDMPACVHPILARFVQRLNDRSMSEDYRWRLVREAGPLLVGTDVWPSAIAVLVVASAGTTVGGLVDALTRADLAWAGLTGADLTGANLTWAYLVWADLTGADLTGAGLTGADLTGANLTDADLTDANLTRADLTGCRWNDSTVWPEGFVPPVSA